MDERYDVVVIGGGAAGLNGALMLARSRRSVLVIDAGAPRNAPASGVHGLLGREGVPPAELLATGRAEVRGYGGRIEAGEVTAARRTEDGFAVTLADGRQVRARRLLVTSGLTDELPNVAGLRERWGRDVLHCPYCHGWEVRDQAIGVLAGGAMSVHQALLFSQLSPDVAYFRRDTALDRRASRAVRRAGHHGCRRRGGGPGDRRRPPGGSADAGRSRGASRRAGGRAADGRAGGLPRRVWAWRRSSTRAGPASTSRPVRRA